MDHRVTNAQQPGGTAPPDGAATPDEPPHKESVKETIESILVAFILAFVFRAFVVEAFVIPSGSMAPTLLGAHMRLRCAECGYQFDVNYPSGSSSQEDPDIPKRIGPKYLLDGGVKRSVDVLYSMHCPNCGFQVQEQDARPDQSAKNTPVHYGDRILVLKYLYLLQEPSRWDVVVFKTPTPSRGEDDYTTHFIKRLVGKPGETIMLLDGDVYVKPNEAADDPANWKVQPKPRSVQQALWRIVYDNDFIATNQSPVREARPWTLPWRQTQGDGWNIDPKSPSRILRFQSPNGSASFSFDKDANPGTYPLTDWLPYNETKEIHQPFDQRRQSLSYEAYASEIPRWNVSDLKLMFTYQRKSGPGVFRAMLTKLDETFIAEFHPDHLRVLHRGRDGQEVPLGTQVLLNGDDLLNVEFQNVDYRVTLRINGRDVYQSTETEYAPDVTRLLQMYEEARSSSEKARTVFGPPRIEISAERQACELSHLSLWRDIYYTPSYYNYGEDIRHAGPPGTTFGPITLHKRDAEHENEYFVLGDNSILSGDARGWTSPVDLRAFENLYTDSGRVPERFLLGKAFFVYWPAGYRPLTSDAPGIIPNFGDMRFIR